MKNGWYACEENLVNSVYIEDIRGYKNVESEILKYMDDMNSLEPEWRCEIPV